MMMNGWVKLHRKMLDNPVVMQSPNHLAVWIYLLTRATSNPFRVIFDGKETVLAPGQLVTSRASITEALNIKNKHGKLDDTKVQRILKAFENAQQISQIGTNKNRLITIKNWKTYQSVIEPNAQQTPDDSTTAAQPMHTNREEKKKKKTEKKRKTSMSFCQGASYDLQAYENYSIFD